MQLQEQKKTAAVLYCVRSVSSSYWWYSLAHNH